MPSPDQISTVIVPAASNWLVSLDDALDELGLTSDGSTQDTQVGRMISRVSAAISTYCDRVFVRQSYRDQFRYAACFDWGKPLMLSQAPIAVDEDGDLVLIVSEDGTAVAAAEWEANRSAGTLYRLDSAAGVSAWSGSLVVVDYDAGFDVIPEDLQAAALEWMGVRWATRGRDPALRSLSIPDVVAETYFDPAAASSGAAAGMPSTIRNTLDQYRRISI
jgi:hypothetical protein